MLIIYSEANFLFSTGVHIIMISRPSLEKIYSKRRKNMDWDFGYPFHKRLIRRLEQANKVIWTGLLGKVIGVQNVSAPLDPQTVHSILFIRNDAIGDMVMTTPIWHVIRKQFPHIRIGVATSIRNSVLLDHDPNVDRRFDATEGDWKALFRARKDIGTETWDIVIPMNYGQKTRMALLSRFLAPNSISSTLIRPGENEQMRRKLFGIVVSSPFRTEEIEMIEQMRIHLTGVLDMQIPDEDWRPRLYPDPESVRFVNERKHQLMEADGSSDYIHINLEARTAFREYGLPSSLELSRRLSTEFPNTSIFLTSSPQAALKSKTLLSYNSIPRTHYFRTDNLHELLAVVQGAALVVTPDTSVVHIASAFERPVVALYPLRHEWPPYKTPYRLLLPEREQPVSSIPVEAVFDACKKLFTIPVSR
jgi:ADP-heptose:LPS heptosyltransferase